MDEKEKRVCFFSLRDIRQGEELSYTYPTPKSVGLGGTFERCACRAPGCHGRMNKREDQF